jgi:hypothetical protein
MGVLTGWEDTSTGAGLASKLGVERTHPHPGPSMVGYVRGCGGVTVTTLRGDGHGLFVDTDARAELLRALRFVRV